FPDPPERLTEGGNDPRLEFLRELFERNRRKNPDFDRIHYVDAEGPEECVLLLAHTFCDVQNGIEPLMSPYREWFEAQDLGASYDYYANLLRMLDWQRPGRRWLLKSPAHLWALDSIVRLFPDACIVQTHRDPVEIVPSYCSMMSAVMSIRESVDAAELGRAVLDHLVALVERGMAARRRCDPSRFIDIDYTSFVAKPLDTVESIYEQFSLPLDDATRQALRSYAGEHRQAKHGSHDYSLEDYGLSREEVRERFADYGEHFGLPGY
ncbi:MAG: sulfotransferase, partial [Candidatus Binatia bacterium]